MVLFLQIYCLTANLSIILIPNYRPSVSRMAATEQGRRKKENERERHAVLPLYHHISHWIQRIYLTPVQSVSVLKETESEVLDNTYIIKCQLQHCHNRLDI